MKVTYGLVGLQPLRGRAYFKHKPCCMLVLRNDGRCGETTELALGSRKALDAQRLPGLYTTQACKDLPLSISGMKRIFIRCSAASFGLLFLSSLAVYRFSAYMMSCKAKTQLTNRRINEEARHRLCSQGFLALKALSSNLPKLRVDVL